MAFGLFFRRGDDKNPRLDPEAIKRKEHDMADAIRDVLTPDYLARLADLAMASPYSRLAGALEQLELAGERPLKADEPTMSDQKVISIAQNLVGLLNSISEPNPRLRLMQSDSLNGTYRETLQDLGGGLNIKDCRRMATELAQPLRPLVPNPKMGRYD